MTLQGGTIETKDLTTIDGCKQMCESKPERCVAFIVRTNTNKCILKNDKHGPETEAPSAMAVRMSCYEG